MGTVTEVVIKMSRAVKMGRGGLGGGEGE